MENIAVYTPTLTIYWSSVIVALGAIAFFALGYALFTSHYGSGFAMLLFIPLCTFLSVVLSRMIHWYCHQEQYSSFYSAVTDYSNGSYCLVGVILAIMISVLVVRAFCLTKNALRMLDCLAPAAALGLAVIRLSSLFNSACRSKIVITNPLLQRLPLAATVSASGGSSEYRFATFFTESFLLFILTVVLLNFFYHHRRDRVKGSAHRDGNVFMMFLTGYSAIEVVLDSTRYDSSFLPFNGFVSIVQIFATVLLVAVLVYYSIWSIRTNGCKWYHWVMWVGFLLMAGGAGVTEYLVQRHGNWYLSCYTAMSFACIMLAVIVHRMYRTVCTKD